MESAELPALLLRLLVGFHQPLCAGGMRRSNQGISLRLTSVRNSQLLLTLFLLRDEVPSQLEMLSLGTFCLVLLFHTRKAPMLQKGHLMDTADALEGLVERGAASHNN